MDQFYVNLIGISAVFIGIMVYSWIVFEAVFRPSQWFSPDNKAIVITGCDSGIGYHLAQHFYEKGSIVFAGFLNAQCDGAKSLRRKCQDENRFHTLQMDVTNDDQVQNAFDYVEKFLENNKLTGLWSLINNAGVCISGEFDWLTIKQCQSIVDVNVLGTIRVTKIFLPLIINAKGRIINVSSVIATNPFHGMSVYSATKSVIDSISHSLRLELSRFGVKVVLIKPSDLIKHTNLLSNQEQHFNEMWNCMSQVKRKFYNSNGYFDVYKKITYKMAGITSPPNFDDAKILKDFNESVYAVEPRIVIVNGGVLTKLILLLSEFVPLSWRDKITKYYFKRMFGFQADKLDVRVNSD